jgi:hypothetical protein
VADKLCDVPHLTSVGLSKAPALTTEFCRYYHAAVENGGREWCADATEATFALPKSFTAAARSSALKSGHIRSVKESSA